MKLPMSCLGAAAAIALLAPAPASADAFLHPAATAPPFRTSDYWAFADRIAAALDDRWTPRWGAYRSLRPGDPTVRFNIRYNASILMAHAVAALRDHKGPSRRDARARSLVRRITSPRAWKPVPDTNSHLGRPAPCWATDLFSQREGHMSLDPKVAEALTWAWRARRALHLPQRLSALIVREVNACAHHPIWRYPSLTGSQINWFADLYSSAATVTGSGALLRGDYRRQLTRFIHAIRSPMYHRRSNNLGVGYQYHYHPELPASAAINLDSAEYANIVIHALGHYDQALRARMRPLPARAVRLVRSWAARVLGGYWTHAGYLNWDTGLGTDRWHSAQYWAFAQQGLQALSVSPRFWPRREYGRWAKAIFDEGLLFYLRLADEAGEAIAPYRMWGIASQMEEYDCYTARMLANAARAIVLGMGRLPATVPPPLWSFDYDTGRMAISTPYYSTALVPFNRGAFAYGGIDPVRLFGVGQRPLASLGGVPPQAMGVVVRSKTTHEELLASSRTLHRGRGRPLRVVASPVGAIRHPHAYPSKPYAGPFRGHVEVIGYTARGRLSIRTHHFFRPKSMELRWLVKCRGGRCDDNIVLHRPTYGERAPIKAVMDDGSELLLAGSDVQAAPIIQVRDLKELVLGNAPGYTVKPLLLQEDAHLRVVQRDPDGRRQDTNPDPGPTLAIVLALPNGFEQRQLKIEVTPGQLTGTPAPS